jgi:hypothetical protein
MKKLFFISLTLLFVTGCGPVKIEGDVFLVKGDGTPQPAAAKDVIFIKGNSLEEILIDSYLETINNKKINYKTSTLCSSVSNLLKDEIAESEESLNTAKLDQVSNNITDQDGTCSNKQIQLEEASIAYQDRISEYELTLSDLKSKRASAQKNIDSIINEGTRYSNIFESYLSIALYKSGLNDYLLRIENKEYFDLKMEGRVCLQFYENNKAIGRTYKNSTADCEVNKEDLYDGIELNSSTVNFPNDFIRRNSVKFSEYVFNHICEEPSRVVIYRPKILFPTKSLDEKACGHSPSDILKFKLLRKDGKGWTDEFGSLSDITTDYEEILLDIAEINESISGVENQIKEDFLRLSMVDAQGKYNTCISSLKNNDQATENISVKNSQLEIVSSCQYEESYDILDAYRFSLPEPEFVDDFFIDAATEEALKTFSNPDYVTQTGINGHYQIDEIQKGNYVAISNYTDSFNNGIYIQELIIDDDLNIDFNNNTFISSVSIPDIIQSLYRGCMDQFCNEIDLEGALDLEVLEYQGIQRAKQREKELEEFNKTIRRLLE